MRNQSEPSPLEPATESKPRGPFPTMIVGVCVFIASCCWYVDWTFKQTGLRAAKREPMLADINWAERGTDPGTPSFKPTVVTLAGTFESTNNSGFFEIHMRGRDLYLRREWKGGYWWHWEIESVVTNDYQRYSWRWRGNGSGGGGGSGHHGETAFVLARRIWSTDGFVGASENQLQSEDKSEGKFEAFSDLTQYGPYKIPTMVRFKDHNGEKTYHVRKVLFTNQPGPDWFASEPWRQRRIPPAARMTNEISIP